MKSKISRKLIFFIVIILASSSLFFFFEANAINVRIEWKIAGDDMDKIQNIYILRRIKGENSWGSPLAGPFPSNYFYYIDSSIEASGVYEYGLRVEFYNKQTRDLKLSNGADNIVSIECSGENCAVATENCNSADWETGEWEECSEVCGGGIQIRTVSLKEGISCTGEGGKPIEEQECNIDPCLPCTPETCADKDLTTFCGNKDFSDGCEGTISCEGTLNCTDSCDNFKDSVCNNNSCTACLTECSSNNDCDSGYECQDSSCIIPPEPVDGGWSSWGEWTPSCPANYLLGNNQTRTRSCDSPAPANGGADCSGSDSENRSCDDFYPILNSFAVNGTYYDGSNIVSTDNSAINISWTAEAGAESINLQKIEIWKADKNSTCDRSGAGLDACDWKKLETINTSLESGNKDISLSNGGHYFGIHVVDIEDKFITEEQATNTRDQEYGPIEVIVDVPPSCTPKNCDSSDLVPALNSFCGTKDDINDDCGETISCTGTLNCSSQSGSCGEYSCVDNACVDNLTPSNYGDSCDSSVNNCGDVNTGTINCDGDCDASMPANRDLENDPDNCGTCNNACFNDCGAYADVDSCVNEECESCLTSCVNDDNCDSGYECDHNNTCVPPASDDIFILSFKTNSTILPDDIKSFNFNISFDNTVASNNIELFLGKDIEDWGNITYTYPYENRNISAKNMTTNGDPAVEGEEIVKIVFECLDPPCAMSDIDFSVNSSRFVDVANNVYESSSGIAEYVNMPMMSFNVVDKNDLILAISNFDVTPAESTGEFTISWEVFPGDITRKNEELGKLGSFELWRKEVLGSWEEIYTSNDTNKRSWNNTPPNIGNYEYGLHMVSKYHSSIYGTESTSGFSPLSVKKIYGKPKISNFSVNPTESEDEFTISWTITESELDKVGYYELWRKEANRGWSSSDLVINNISAQSLNVSDIPPVYAKYTYGLHIVNKDNSDYGTESTSGFSPIEVKKKSEKNELFAMVDWLTYGDTHYSLEQIDKALEILDEAKISTIRVDFQWFRIETINSNESYFKDNPLIPGYNYDLVVDKIREKGIDILGVITNTPPWASSHPKADDFRNENEQPKTPDEQIKMYSSMDTSTILEIHNSPPLNYDDFSDFMYKVVDKYKDKVKYWEVWNEPNAYNFLKDYREGKLNHEIYFEMNKAAYNGAKRASSNVNIVMGGISGNGLTNSGSDALWKQENFLNKLVDFNDGEILKYFDIWNIHPYAWGLGSNERGNIQMVKNRIKKFSQFLDSKRDEGYLVDKPVWLGELGVSTYWLTESCNDSPCYAGGLSPTDAEEFKANLVSQYYNEIPLEFPFVDKIFYYLFKPVPAVGQQNNEEEKGLGLVQWDKQSKSFILSKTFCELASLSRGSILPACNL